MQINKYGFNVAVSELEQVFKKSSRSGMIQAWGCMHEMEKHAESKESEEIKDIIHALSNMISLAKFMK